MKQVRKICAKAFKEKAVQLSYERANISELNEFHALPVCLGDLLAGIVTTTDLIKYLIDQY